MGSNPSRKPVVAVFLHRYRWGEQVRGDERGFVEKAKRYRRRGIRVMAVEILPSIQSGMGESAYESVPIGHNLLPASSPLDLIRLLVLGAIGCLRLPRRPLAVYVYNQDIANLVVGLLLKVELGGPMVIVHHQVDEREFQPFPKGYAARRLAGHRWPYSVWRSVLSALALFCARRGDFHLALSESTREEVRDIIGVDNCTVVGNGVDCKEFKPLETEKIYDACFLGRLVPQKGIDVILEAWKLVLVSKPDARLVLIGGGERPLLEKYNRMTDELGLRKSVTLTGFVPDWNVVVLLNASRLFVFPSRKEGFAQAVAQAMACGCCCVISDIPALRENYSQVAALVQKENPSALSREILRLLSDEQLRTDMGVRSRLFIQKFSWDAVVEREISALGLPTYSAIEPGLERNEVSGGQLDRFQGILQKS